MRDQEAVSLPYSQYAAIFISPIPVHLHPKLTLMPRSCAHETQPGEKSNESPCKKVSSWTSTISTLRLLTAPGEPVRRSYHPPTDT
jgi:hypothetical protein